MYKGIYIAASGAILKQTQLEVISQNLANVNTTGFKKDSLAFKEYLLDQMTAGPGPDGRAMTSISAYKTDFSNGTIVKSSNPLDLALEGPGFFTVEGNRYMRRGDFKRSVDGFLVTSNDLKVMGSKGPIKLPNETVEINEKGDINVKGAIIDTLKLADFKNKDGLVKAGDGMFMTEEQAGPAKASVKQGYTEISNVDAVKEMVKMIEMLREFETYQKAIQTFDDATAKVTNDLGRL
jgi:flagellar basal-body rod protein FlgG